MQTSTTIFPRVTIAAHYLDEVSHSGEFTIITRDAIRNSARSAVWSVPRSGVAGRKAAGAGGGAVRFAAGHAAPRHTPDTRSGTISDRVTGDDRELSTL